LDDVKERERDAMDPNGYTKPTKILTLTDMRAKRNFIYKPKVLSDIE
jgi:hypothetical protein